MPSTLPEGEPPPADGGLPATATTAVGARFGVYLHVPFCASRCGYCDFNTYTAAELGGGASREGYADTVLAELALAAGCWGPPPPAVATVFVGGGTPTLLPADDLARMLDAIDRPGAGRRRRGDHRGQPGIGRPRTADRLRAAGYTRISLGMQSAAPDVLAILDRKHTPAGPPPPRGGARRRLRARQPGPDLRHARGERRRLRRPLDAVWPRGWTTSARTP